MSNYKFQDENAELIFGGTEKFKITKSLPNQSLTITNKRADLVTEDSIKITDGEIVLLKPSAVVSPSVEENSKTLATTEFSQLLAGNFSMSTNSSNYIINDNATLDYTHCGKLLEFRIAASSKTWIVPSPVGKKGYCLRIWNNSTVGLTLSCVSADFVNLTTGSGNTILIPSSMYIEFCSNGNNWILINKRYKNSYTLRSIVKVVSSQTYNFSSGVVYFIAFVLGGGGGGGGTSGTSSGQRLTGGGGGSGSLQTINSTNLSSRIITIGAGGAGILGQAGGNGGTTLFGNTTASGGVGGMSNILTTMVGRGGSGGQSAVTDARDAVISYTYGNTGMDGHVFTDGISTTYSGEGASTMFGSGGIRRIQSNGDGFNSFGYGGGGGGGMSLDVSSNPKYGGTGGQGIVVIYEYGD